jgi:arylformamidase
MEIHDISLPVSPDLPVWPGDPKIVLERIRAISAGDASNDSRIDCSVHSGTHVDAPAHFIDGGASVDRLPLAVLVGPAEVVSLPDVDRISSGDLEALNLAGNTRRLLLKTRNSELWEAPSPHFDPDYVALDSGAARWIVEKGIRLVGVDYLSVQRFADRDATTHRVLLEAGVVIVEGLNLTSVAPGRYRLVCLPLKLVGSDGAPARTILIKE